MLQVLMSLMSQYIFIILSYDPKYNVLNTDPHHNDMCTYDSLEESKRWEDDDSRKAWCKIKRTGYDHTRGAMAGYEGTVMMIAGETLQVEILEKSYWKYWAVKKPLPMS